MIGKGECADACPGQCFGGKGSDPAKPGDQDMARAQTRHAGIAHQDAGAFEERLHEGRGKVHAVSTHGSLSAARALAVVRAASSSGSASRIRASAASTSGRYSGLLRSP